MRRESLPTLITTSSIREELAGNFGIRSLSLQTDSEERTQKKIKQEHNGGCLTPFRRSPNSPPIPLELAIDKAGSIRDYNSEQHLFFTADSCWSILYPAGNPFFPDIPDNEVLIHKPKDEEDRSRVIEVLKMAAIQGANLRSVSGVALVRRGVDKEFELTPLLVSIDYGTINPQMDLASLEQRLRDNGHWAGGLDSFTLLRDEPPHIITSNTRREVVVTIQEFDQEEDWRIRRGVINFLRYPLSFDPTNFTQLSAFSVGIIPDISRL